MTNTRFLALLCTFCCVFGLCVGASAVEVDSGSTYCFGTGDFSDEEIAGICITDLPEEMGALMLEAVFSGRGTCSPPSSSPR